MSIEYMCCSKLNPEKRRAMGSRSISADNSTGNFNMEFTLSASVSLYIKLGLNLMVADLSPIPVNFEASSKVV